MSLSPHYVRDAASPDARSSANIAAYLFIYSFIYHTLRARGIKEGSGLQSKPKRKNEKHDSTASMSTKYKFGWLYNVS